MSILQRGFVALIAIAVFITAYPVTAQIPDKFTNLKVLPEDISKRELMGVMRSFAGALGKRCNYCHVGDDPSDFTDYDFASDDKEQKRTARIMMQMTHAINNTHLAELKQDNVTEVRCITCHHGVDKPQTIDNIVVAAVKKDGLDAGLARYRELREAYYGAAAYDFTAGPLQAAAEALAGDDVPAAMAITKMNIEFNPEDPFSHLLLAQLHQMSGDKAAAITSVERALELDPENDWAKGMLDKLKASE